MKKKTRLPPSRTGERLPTAGSDPRRTADRPARSALSAPQPGWLSPAALREIVESVVVAFVLAFLFRTFEAEAFVIPTGSMAPTLMGRHKDLVCPMCRYPYQINASVEDRKPPDRREEVYAGTCPMCRFTMHLKSPQARSSDTSSFKGDRIIVAKFPYHLGEPDRWDVAVFMFPGEAKMNYIKRIVGLPGETIKIKSGNVFTNREGSQQFTIAGKPPDKILAMMQPVYDNDYVTSALDAAGWPARWQPAASRGGEEGWRSADGKSFSTAGAARDEVWLRYRHLLPSHQDWLNVLAGKQGFHPLPQLITDFAFYNTNDGRSDSREGGLGPEPSSRQLGLHWVGDLILEFTLEADSAAGKVMVDLVRGGRRFLCKLDLSTGQAGLAISGLDGFGPTAMTKARGPGKHRIRFANVDDQLTLWVDDRVVKFDQPTKYDSSPLDVLRPREEDLAPARIGSQGAAVRVSHLKLFRDIYYIALHQTSDGGGSMAMSDFETSHVERSDPLREFYSDPSQWGAFNDLREVEFKLHRDQFFVLGDNSSESKDSRLWEAQPPNQCYVTRDLLKGKAMVIYWPHSWDRTPGFPPFRNGIWFPMFPNLARMRFVR